MQKILKQVGVKTVFTKGEIKIYGKTFIENKNKKINVPDLGDHRICMSTLIYRLRNNYEKNIEDCFRQLSGSFYCCIWPQTKGRQPNQSYS